MKFQTVGMTSKRVKENLGLFTKKIVLIPPVENGRNHLPRSLWIYSIDCFYDFEEQRKYSTDLGGASL